MRQSQLFITTLIGLIISIMPCINQAANEDVIAIIASPDFVGKTITKSELTLIFWRKKLYWQDGKRVRPINFSTDLLLRNQFSKRVLNSLPDSQNDYWNGLYYHGISPPHIVHSTEAMLRLVAEVPGAIGYVANCEADSRVKVLAWINEEGDILKESPSCDAP